MIGLTFRMHFVSSSLIQSGLTSFVKGTSKNYSSVLSNLSPQLCQSFYKKLLQKISKLINYLFIGGKTKDFDTFSFLFNDKIKSV